MTTRPLPDAMSKLDRVIEGLQIFKSLGAKWTWAEHDKLGVEFPSTPGSTDRDFPNESQKDRLTKIGWFFDEQNGAWATFT